MEILTRRLRLRRWRDADRAAFAALNADPAVMRYFPAPLTPEQSDALADRITAHFERHGFGALAVEYEGHFIGFTGLSIPTFSAEFTPCVEIGWRLAAAHWNRGLATEAAQAVIDYAFGTLGLPEIVSFTTEANLSSRRVMEKIGMTYSCDFDHPDLPPGHPLRRHVLYRLRNPSAR